ncbi:hypothetical protein NKG05_26110 [Oerskovia sp. M15]
MSTDTDVGSIYHRFTDGAAFILDQPEGIPARWGEGDLVIWARARPS